jgi:hypothetical protein
MPETEVTEEPVGGKRRLPEDLRKLPPPETPPKVHLEEAILGVAEPLGEIEVVPVRGGDVRDPVPVPDDLDGGGKALDGEGALSLRNAGPEKGGAGSQEMEEGRGEKEDPDPHGNLYR